MSTRSHSHLQTKTDRIKCSRLLHHRTRHSRNIRGSWKSESKFFQRFPDLMPLDWFNWSRLSVSVICVLQRRASLVKCVNNNATASSGNRFHCSNFETLNVSRSSFDFSERYSTIWHRCTVCRPRRFYAKKNCQLSFVHRKSTEKNEIAHSCIDRVRCTNCAGNYDSNGLPSKPFQPVHCDLSMVHYTNRR